MVYSMMRVATVSESQIIIQHSMMVNVTKSYMQQKQVNIAGDSCRCLMG